jgi:hypothetical protein
MDFSAVDFGELRESEPFATDLKLFHQFQDFVLQNW